jgi:hypothetical protein
MATLFIGLYAVRELGTCQPGQRDPITGEDVTRSNLYKLDLDHRLHECRDHLVVD